MRAISLLQETFGTHKYIRRLNAELLNTKGICTNVQSSTQGVTVQCFIRTAKSRP